MIWSRRAVRAASAIRGTGASAGPCTPPGGQQPGDPGRQVRGQRCRPAAHEQQRNRKREPVGEYPRTVCLDSVRLSFTPVMRRLLTRAARRGDTEQVAAVRDALRLAGDLVTCPFALLNLKRLVETA
jgi:hypothetical protein